MSAMTSRTPPAAAYSTDDARWAAVRQRDAAADGAFVYCVRTTGVYCRPSCPSRRPRRENVRFHASGAEAQRAGFRACKRCRPNDATLAEERAGAIARACRTIESAEGPIDLAALAAAAGMSRFHFHRVFKSLTGLTPGAYAAARRSQRVRDALARGMGVTRAIYAAGFESSGRFYATAAKSLGMTPRAFRAGGRGETIRFALGECSLGAILVAASEKGICAIALGDEPEALLRELQERFPAARLIGADAAFEQWMAKVVGFVDAPRLGLDLPLDVRGTAFQQRVWRALCALPPGTTLSYGALAAKLGMPNAARAVARACASNPIAVAIPCHRVVRTDGALSGYRWGVERKRALLAREAARSGG
jgi:AraC family transcriptional regulator of adaptative response/methylated-DNA-[protein]-cysteine methyltransferase